MKFGLIYHLMYPEEMAERHLSNNLIPCGLQVSREFIDRQIADNRVSVCEATMHIVSDHGDECAGRDWTIPLTPDQLVTDQPRALRMTAAACAMARAWGADMVGLGLMLGKIGGRGRLIQQCCDGPVTNGDSYLVYNAVQVLDQVERRLKLSRLDEPIAIFGFPSAIGRALAEYLLLSGRRVVLISRAGSHIDRQVAELKACTAGKITLTPSLRQMRTAPRIIFTAGAQQQILPMEELTQPSVIIDVSYPRNVTPAHTKKALVVDAGLASLPAGGRLRIEGYRPDRLPACLAELILLTLEKQPESYSIGRYLHAEKIRRIGRLARKYGLSANTLYSFGRLLEKHQLTLWRQMFK
jgi:predicted amino acid dehydrogenase